MAITVLSAYPFIVFGIIEPALLIWAYIGSMLDPFEFLNAQVPNHQLKQADFKPQAVAVSLQLINVYLLLAAVAVVCSWTTHAPVTRWYLIAVAFADYGHIYATYVAMGPNDFWKFDQWNDMVWGNVGASVFLNINRWLTVLGVFGKLRTVTSKNKKQ